MHGEAKLLLKFLDGSDNRYIIPVYQRNYERAASLTIW